MKSVQGMGKQERDGAIYRLECRFLKTQCLASKLLLSEMEKRKVADDPDLLDAVQHLEHMEASCEQQIQVKMHNEFVPLMRGMLQQKEKLAQKHQKDLNNLIYSPYPLRRIQTEKLVQEQEEETRQLTQKHSEQIKKYHDELDATRKENRQKIYTFFQQYIRQLYK